MVYNQKKFEIVFFPKKLKFPSIHIINVKPFEQNAVSQEKSVFSLIKKENRAPKPGFNSNL